MTAIALCSKLAAMNERNEEHWLEPAATVIKKMGGVYNVAKILNITPSAVYRWMWPMRPGPNESRGTGGIIPVRRQQQIMDWSRENGNPVKHSDFFARRRDSAA